jgi:pyridoxal phosphate enzyme, YggS family
MTWLCCSTERGTDGERTMTEEELLERVDRIRRELAEASDGRYPAPKLIAVTKTHPPEMILPLKAAGITDIGENRVQELREKLPQLAGSFRIHLIGRLQRNKVRQIVQDVCMIQSVDSLPLAEEIHSRAAAAGIRMPVLAEVSPAGEAQKGGIPIGETEQFLRQIAPLEGIQVQGLMAVMPLTEDRDYLDGLFARTRSLFERLKDRDISGAAMEELSMGMSGDYRLAAAHGATMVRVGSAIFGPRG